MMFRLNRFKSAVRPSQYYRTYRNHSSSAKQSGGKDVVGIIAFGSICAMTFGLGCWQLQRYQWKIDLIEETRLRYEKELVRLDPRNAVSSQAELYDYMMNIPGQRLSLCGTFQHDKEIKLGPRAAPPGLMGQAAQGMATNPQGFFLMTPFQLENGMIVFINRGWFPRHLDDNEISRPTGAICMTNLIVSACEKKNTFTPVVDEKALKSRTLLMADEESLLKGTQLSQKVDKVILLEVIQPDNIPLSLPYPVARRFQQVSEPSVTPITHLTYAVTWYSLAAVGMFMTYKKFRTPKLRRNVVR